jgi:hypothetical protein
MGQSRSKLQWAAAGIVALACIAPVGCQSKPPEPPRRAELKRVGASTVQLIPSAGQLPFCLAFSVSQAGVVRQLTMSHENLSMRCDADKPVGNLTFRIPADEGQVKVHVIFSDRKLQAASIAQQIYELHEAHRRITSVDLRAPGKVVEEMLEFEPQAENEATVGAVIGVPPADAGTGQAAP